jgi:YegS/Rv2252/BmrU family lipid kinase
MTSVAVVAHNRKQLGDGLPALRKLLADHGIVDPLWFEVPKSSKIPKRIRQALDKGADLVLVWGGDGSVQRAIDAAVGSPVTLAILPAGTANLLASNLAIPKDLEQAVDIAMNGVDRTLDVGVMNGEHFAVMGGIGLDSLMIRDADGAAKKKLGRAAYVFAAARRARTEPVKAVVKVDGAQWYKGPASCILVGNVGQLMGGLTVFEDARPDDGALDLAVVSADGVWQWARALSRAVAGHAEKSPLVQMTRAHKVSIRIDRPLPYEMDGGARSKTDKLKVKVVPSAVRIRVMEPRPD